MLKNKILQVTRYEQIKHWYFKYERLLMPATLLFGFIVDAFTFRTIDIESAFILLLVHIVLAGSAIAYINMYDAGKIKGLGWKMLYVRYGRLLAPFLLQLSFGALLSAAFIFYFFGSSFAISWPLLIVILLLAFSNEIFRDYYVRPIVQISMYYFTILTVAALIFPYIFKTISVWSFALASVASMVLIVLYIRLLSKKIRSFAEQQQKFKAVAIGILVIMNVFYFYNIIPPVPLSLSEEGVYHMVTHQGDEYILEQEVLSFWDHLTPRTVIHVGQYDPVYVFTAIRAPRGLHTQIVHHWQWYNKLSNEWVSKDELSFQLSGGRELGYRGYSYKTILPEGTWRVDIETEDGRVFGRVRFDIERVQTPVETEEVLQ